MYWESQKKKKPELFLLSQILLALPVTQVSMERAYFGLYFILSDFRYSSFADLLERIFKKRANSFFGGVLILI